MKRVLFQGDSITDAGRNREIMTSLGRGYPNFAAGLWGLDHPGEFEFWNRGVSGNRVADLYARIKLDTINLQPDHLSVLIGVNDVWHEVTKKNGFSEAKFERMLDLYFEDVLEALPRLRCIVMGAFVLEGSATENNEEYPDRWEIFRSEVPLRAAAAERVAKKYGFPFLSLQPLFDEACKRAPADQWLKDGVHPTPQGHALIAREWMKVFEKMI